MNDVVPRAPVSVRPDRFYTKYIPQPDGSTRDVDWVEYYAAGEKKFTITPEAISRLKKRTDGVWEALEPYYEAWKKGHDVPANGTALAAWPGVTPELADLLRQNSIRTVEEIRDLTDNQISRLRIPKLRELRDQARNWDAAKDSRKVETALLQKDEEIALLKMQMADLAALIQKPPENAEPAKPRGRPRKAEEVEE